MKNRTLQVATMTKFHTYIILILNLRFKFQKQNGNEEKMVRLFKEAKKA